MHWDLLSTGTWSVPGELHHDGCAQVGSAVSAFPSVQRQSCIFLLYSTTPAVTDNKKRKGNCVVYLEKVAELHLLCALMLTKFCEICLEMRMGLNTLLNFNILFDTLL